MQNKYKLIDTNDSIDFGQQIGEPFKWIFLLDTHYLIWLIEETDVCFANLDLFYAFGKPLIINENIISKEEISYLSNLSRSIGKNINSTGLTKYKITIEILANAIDLKIITPKHFIERNFKFEDKIIKMNNNKLLNCKPYYNSINSKRDNHLKNIFKI
ncbi:hypothetical protein [uncultured Flavobacterium sp.]|uniref:hypothetical protein n=1 Tax=uncultured Flavobacterium sp. TaxID=165435 RepID=UPI0030EF58EA|tara:strand:- start:59183 stop:59656 length:474 start_codon:yes stop_codon:yes gene_type:complete